jgi:hypothetical protein
MEFLLQLVIIFYLIYMYTNIVLSAAFREVPGLTTPIHVLPLLHDMFRSHKDYRQVCISVYKPFSIFIYISGVYCEG